MLLRLFLLFTLVPIAELYLLVWISSVTSVWVSVGLVLGTGVLGAALVRRQGWWAWQRVQRQLSRGEPPAAALVDGLMILIAGALLITPGILTDLAGLALLVPPVRAAVQSRLLAWFKARAVMQFQTPFSAGFAAFHQADAHRAGAERNRADQGASDSIIDVEFTRHPPDRNLIDHEKS